MATALSFFSLTRGTRQGCPLSPLLFAMVIEPLAACVRDSTNIQGLKLDNNEHKISLYADDILLYITDPEKSISHLQNAIKQFGSYSGYRINFNKSNAIFLHMTPTEKMLTSCGFNCTPKGFKYLGIFITPTLDKLLTENYTPLTFKIKSDLLKWSSLPLSLLGRINVIKLNVLPRFNFFFQMLPCFLSVEFFKSINSSLSRFIWNNKKPRISLKTLMKPESMGGLGLPNFQYYFWAAQLRNLISWSMERYESLWVQMEAKPFEPLPLISLLFINHFEKIKNMDKCFSVFNTLQTWRDCRKKSGITSCTSIYSPIFQNPDLNIQITMVNIGQWINSGVIQFKDLLNLNMQLKSFIDLRSEYNIPNKHFFKYLQIRSITHSLIKEKKLRLGLSEVEDNLLSSNTIKGKISNFYNIFPIVKKYLGEGVGEKFRRQCLVKYL